MGFFQDLKEDLSQAVNELMPDELLGSEESQKAKAEEIEEIEEIEEDTEEENIEEIEEEQVSEIAVDMAELKELLGKDEKEERETSFSPDMVADIEAALMEDEDEVEEIEEIEEIEDEIQGDEEKRTLEQETEVTAKQESRGNTTMAEATKLTGVATDETAVITAGMTISGDISSKGSVDVLGTINGNVESLGKLDIAGTINGDSKAAEIYAESANITGEVRSEGAIKIGQSSVIIGNIYATSAVIAGAVKGDIDVKGPVVLDTTAIVMGNIKSKSVQINNGAVIEGLCSQCYAEVNPTAFFDDLKKKK